MSAHTPGVASWGQLHAAIRRIQSEIAEPYENDALVACARIMDICVECVGEYGADTEAVREQFPGLRKPGRGGRS